MKIVQNPVATCDQVYALIQSLTSQIRKRMEDPKSAGEASLCDCEEFLTGVNQYDLPSNRWLYTNTFVF